MVHSVIKRRLQRLQRSGFYCIMALDHGLSSGAVDGIPTLEALSLVCEQAAAAGVPAVVLNSGVISKVEPPANLHIVAQTVGMPLYSVHGAPRVVLASLEASVASGADAISVQLAPTHDQIQVVESISRIIEDCHRLGLPVLLMINRDAWSTPGELINAVRAVAELGSDLLKVTAGNILDELEPDALAGMGVPVLFAGGPSGAHFAESLKQAARVGFGGICVGRNIFQASHGIASALVDIDTAFAQQDADR